MTPKFLIYLSLVAMLVVFCAPVAEGTLRLFACLTGSPLCPFSSTTPRCPKADEVYDPVTRTCAAA
ncbi:uncharacterized protein LOC6561165 [Drosophila grimshawi]|uniref:GH20954 n=1 Tax=Drosophila grimshawi TaxID=7222 RepID=B4J4A5_DROGR|nr:uncharacterized protein LOC6561165 [Drosophila grimshawi]EDW00585.1 GH20954 [Drosophila grimshawi]